MKTRGQKYLVVFRSIVKDSEQRILLLRRAKNRKYNPGKWEFPGGKLQSGVEIGTSIENHMELETGIVVKPTAQHYYYQSRLVTEKGKYLGFTYVEIVGEAEYLGGKVKIGGDITDFAWVPLQNVFNYDLSLESKKSLAKYSSEVLERHKSDGPGKIPVLLTAKALIRNDKGQYLFLQRSRSDFAPLKWEIPGGKLNSFEVLGELLKREVFEETGLVVSIDKPAIYINSQVLGQGKYKGYTFIEIVSEASVRAGMVAIGEEHESFKWVFEREIFALDLAETTKLPLTEIFLKVGVKK